MQRLFVMFPDRGPGLGLLWLRLCLAGALCAPGLHDGGLVVLCALGVALLVLGWLTPLSAGLACAGLWLQDAALPLLVLPLALLLLGPGAYSLDARQFGRRRLGRRPPPNG